jgi:peptide-methionine (S)-S-oxide reductase
LWADHWPVHPAFSRQYRSAVFVADDAQRAAAEASLACGQERSRARLYAAIEPLDRFYLAEDYHQKYYLRGYEGLAAEFTAMYPSEADLVDSTAVARANGFVSGYGTPELLAAEIDTYGLSTEGRGDLLGLARAVGARFRCGI